MAIRYGSVHQKILARICVMPKAVRGMSAEMLLREFGDTGALDDLAASGLLKKRGWMDGPGTIWIPTAKGEALHQTMIEAPCLSTISILSDDNLLVQRSN